MAHPDFNPPGVASKLTGRRSTLTGLFFTSITPYIEPSEHEVDKVLEILGMTRGACVCAYCGNPKSEWDHFRAIVKDRKPTGYITEIDNLVPSCGKCNQSRGNKDWKAWMTGKAKHSPTTRGVVGIQERIARLENFEKWSKPIRLDYEQIAKADQWAKHLQYLDDVLSILEQAEKHAKELRAHANEFAVSAKQKSSQSAS